MVRSGGAYARLARTPRSISAWQLDFPAAHKPQCMIRRDARRSRAKCPSMPPFRARPRPLDSLSVSRACPPLLGQEFP
jgi:hypothetical protein